MEPEDVMEFHNRDLPCSLLSTFAEMKDNKDLCDVTIKVKDKYVHAHRLVLAAGVPYFRAMFRSNMVENAKRQVTMEGVDPFAFQCLVDFLYSAKLRITIENVEELLRTSIYLQLTSVIDICFEFVVKRIQPDIVISVRDIAFRANHVSTVMAADRYIREHFEEVSQSEGFLSLTFSDLKQFIASDELFLFSEEVVFEAVVKWVKASPTDRKTFLPELLRHVRMPLLSPGYVTNRVLREDLISSFRHCRTFFLEAKKCQSVTSSSTFFSGRQRYCKEKHHLECAKRTGCALYAFSQTYDGMCSLLYYDSMNESWVTLHQFTEVCRFSYIVCSQEILYLFGTQIFSTFNFDTLQYTSVKRKMRELFCSAAIAHQGNIYFVGGLNSTSSVRRFCPYTGELFYCGRIMQERYCPGITSLAGTIFITGGRSTLTTVVFSDDEGLRSVEQFMPHTGESVAIKPMLSHRYGHGCATLHSKVYVCGGSSRWETEDSCEVYDPQTDQWQSITRTRSVAFPVLLFTYADELYAFEGVYLTKGESFVEFYNRSTKCWMPWKGVPCVHCRNNVTAAATRVFLISDNHPKKTHISP